MLLSYVPLVCITHIVQDYCVLWKIMSKYMQTSQPNYQPFVSFVWYSFPELMHFLLHLLLSKKHFCMFVLLIALAFLLPSVLLFEPFLQLSLLLSLLFFSFSFCLCFLFLLCSFIFVPFLQLLASYSSSAAASGVTFGV